MTLFNHIHIQILEASIICKMSFFVHTNTTNNNILALETFFFLKEALER